MEQQVDWRAGHKYECKSLRRCKPACPDIMIRLAARLLWMRSALRDFLSSLTYIPDVSQ